MQLATLIKQVGMTLATLPVSPTATPTVMRLTRQRWQASRYRKRRSP